MGFGQPPLAFLGGGLNGGALPDLFDESGFVGQSALQPLLSFAVSAFPQPQPGYSARRGCGNSGGSRSSMGFVPTRRRLFCGPACFRSRKQGAPVSGCGSPPIFFAERLVSLSRRAMFHISSPMIWRPRAFPRVWTAAGGQHPPSRIRAWYAPHVEQAPLAPKFSKTIQYDARSALPTMKQSPIQRSRACMRAVFRPRPSSPPATSAPRRLTPR
jgi:hypothetical protein